MDKVTADKAKQLAEQASLAVTEEESEKLAGRLNELLELLDPILELNSSGIEPTFHGVSHRTTWREDEISPSLSLEQVFQNASTRDRDYFKVPRITSLEE